MKTTKKPSFFRPKVGETYYSVEIDGAAYYHLHNYGDAIGEDSLRLRIGNVFRTRDEAKTVAVQFNKIFKNHKSKPKFNKFFKIKK